jgi:hypothetical protein
MSDPLRLTPDALESLLAERDADAVAAFVADLYARTGRDATREGRVVTTTGRNGNDERLLVWTDDRGRIGRLLDGDTPDPDVGAVDAVVTTRRDAAAGALVAADLLRTDDIHDRLLYAMDRDACRELCREHFGRAVDPQPAPEGGSGGITLGGLSRPRLALAAVIVCGLLVAGAAGLPGGGSPDEVPFVPDNGTTTPGTPESGPVTPVGGGPVDTPTETRAETPRPTVWTPTVPAPPLPTDRMPVPPLTPDELAPTITSATAIDLEDGDGVVGDGDLVAVRASVTDNASGVARADAFPDALGVEGPLPMTDTDDDEVYNTTFRVDADQASGDGDYAIGIGAIDEAGNVNVDQVSTNELALNRSERTPGGTATDTLGVGGRIIVPFSPDVAEDAGLGAT